MRNQLMNIGKSEVGIIKILSMNILKNKIFRCVYTQKCYMLCESFMFYYVITENNAHPRNSY